MTRIPFALRASTAFLALTVATAAAAQDTQPPPDVAENPSTTAQEPSSGGDIVITGSRIRRDPLSQDSPITFVDQTDIAKTGLNSVNDILQRLRVRAAASTASSTIRETSATRRVAQALAPARPKSTCVTSVRPGPSFSSMVCASFLARPPAVSPVRPT